MDDMKKTILATLTLVLAAAAASAQPTSLTSAYFMEGYNGRSSLNPAFAAERSWFSLPMIPAMGLSSRSNMGVSTFLYPAGDGLTTFMNSSVSSDEFLGKLNKNNRINESMDLDILSMGIWGRKAYFTFGIRNRTDIGINIPYSLFDFMKNAGKSQYYDISNLSARARNYTEISFGWARQIADKVNAGARLKLLLGHGYADARIDKMHIRMTEDRWSVNSEGSMSVSSGNMLDVKTKEENGTGYDSPDDKDVIDKIGFSDSFDMGALLGGYGAAVDLGAEVELLPGLKLSLAVNDLGFMSWRNTVEASTGDREWTFDGFDNFSFDDDKDNSLSDQLDALGDDLAELAKFHRTATDAVKGDMLAATVLAGAEYVMPFYSGLTAGVLGTARINGPHSWTEGRLYANLKPCSWFSFGVNGSISPFGPAMGAALGFHAAGFNMFIGADSISFKYANATDSGIPYPYGRLNFGLNFGISFNVGRRHDTAPSETLVSL